MRLSRVNLVRYAYKSHSNRYTLERLNSWLRPFLPCSMGYTNGKDLAVGMGLSP